MNSEIKYDVWILRILVIAGLGCSVLYSTQLFDGVKTAKAFYFIIVVCSIIFFLFVNNFWKKRNLIISLSIPDILLAFYMVWAFIRLLTSDTDSIHNLYFWEFAVCVLWYLCMRFFFCISNENDWEKHIYFSLIAFGYVQIFFCVLQLSGLALSFSPIFPVSGTFDNTSELCIYLTCILPVSILAGLKASDITSTGMITRAVCLFYVLCWLTLILAMGSRTALLSGLIGTAVFWGLRRTGFFGKVSSFIRKTLIAGVLLLIAGGLMLLLAQYKKDSANGRLLIWKVAWSGIKDAPMKGKGFNAFQAKYGHFQAVYFQQHSENEKEKMIAGNMNFAMNDYVETAFNLGFIGLLLFVAFWLSLFKGMDFGNPLQLASIAVVVIFLVSSGFYFVEKMLPIKIITLFFAAYAGSINKKNVFIRVRPVLLKFITTMFLIFCCLAGYATINKAKHYVKWKKANTLTQFGYMSESRMEYESIYPCFQFNGLFLYFYAKNLYENKEYRQCLEYMKMAKPQMVASDFYLLFGDAYFETEDYENAMKCYEFVANMVPNRFLPLYKLFRLYEELGKTQQALAIAQNIMKKPIKVDSHEVRQIKKECIDFIHLKQNEQDK